MGTFSRVFLAHRYSEWTFGHGRVSCLGGCRVYTWRPVEGRYVVNAEGFWAERGIFRAAFTLGMCSVAFSCKRGKGGDWGGCREFGHGRKTRNGV